MSFKGLLWDESIQPLYEKAGRFFPTSERNLQCLAQWCINQTVHSIRIWMPTKLAGFIGETMKEYLEYHLKKNQPVTATMESRRTKC